MEIQWLHKQGHAGLIVFCNGWGMDARPFRPLLSENFDVLMLCDYHSLTPFPDIPELSKLYSEMYLVSWSMGVWAGQRLFRACTELFRAKVAINGTLCPIHDELGIPTEILIGTLAHFSEDSRRKLYRRMCRDRENCSHFQENLPGRSLENQRRELESLLDVCDCQQAVESIYSHIMIADKDLVMPTVNQLQFWREENPLRFQAQHFPFYLWPTWDALLAEALQPVFSAKRRLNL